MTDWTIEDVLALVGGQAMKAIDTETQIIVVDYDKGFRKTQWKMRVGTPAEFNSYKVKDFSINLANNIMIILV